MEFDQIYSRLNRNQKKAVDHIDGTVLVIAGPGTGKTQVLGARVASILKSSDTAAVNILCLTFTEAATVALRNRLYSFIGSQAHRVNIHTYHSFCNMVIQENKDAFGVQSVEPVSELELLEIYKEIIDELPNGHLLKRYTGDEYFDTKNLASLFGYLKKENLSVTEVQTLSTTYLEEWKNDEKNYYARNSGKFKKGDLKINDYNRVAKQIQKLQAAAQLIEKYEQKLNQRKRYDFNDMILWVLDVFVKHPEILLFYQERFHYFLVDEYQDTNGAQNDLLFALIDYWNNPNVFVVADDDQSIYKFQGANVENVFHFHQRFIKDVEVFCLTENYRSSQNILDVSNHVIKNNNERIIGHVPGINKNITAANLDVASIKKSVRVNEFVNVSHESIGIAKAIEKLQSEGIDLSSIAVLYKEHRQSEDLISYLKGKEIPYSVVRSQNILEEPLILQLLMLLEYLDLEKSKMNSGEHLLYEIMHFNSFQHLTPSEIAHFSRHCYNERLPWRTNLSDLKNSEGILSNESLKEMRRFGSDVEYWIKQMANVSTQQLVEKVMNKAGFISRALASDDSTYQIRALSTFFNFLKEETAKTPFSGLKEFLLKVKLMQKNSLALRVNKIVKNDSGVNFMTVYGSKGLEFDYVFLMGCTNNYWENKKRSMPFGLNKIVVGDTQTAIEEEARRLFYVALTRARKEVNISYAQLTDEGKALTKSVYIVEAIESGQVMESKPIISDAVYEDFIQNNFKTHESLFKNLTKQDFLKDILDNFRLSATNLNSYLRCPVSFFYQNIIRVPSAKSESMTFGSAMHKAMESLFGSMNDRPSSEQKKLMLDSYSQYLENNKESFVKESFERKLFYGKEILIKFFDQLSAEWQSQNVILETNIKNVELDGIPIRGVIDKIELNGQSANVVDYKTGKYANAKNKLKPPLGEKLKPNESDHNKIYGGDYWRQLLFYKALIENDPLQNMKVISGRVDFLEPEDDIFHSVKMVFNDSDYSLVKAQIIDTYKKIMNSEFEKGCELDNCEWCNFQKHYNAGNLSYNEMSLSEKFQEIDER